MKESCVRLEFTICTAVLLSHEIWNCTPANSGAQILTSMMSTNNSRAVMCKAKLSIWRWKANEMHSLKQVAPPRCNEESRVNRTSWKSDGCNWIKKTSEHAGWEDRAIWHPILKHEQSSIADMQGMLSISNYQSLLAVITIQLHMLM